MKWAVLGHNILESRYKVLSDFLRQKGVENQLNIVECANVEFQDRLNEVMKDSDQIRIESPFREQIMSLFKSQPMMVASIGAADCLVKRDGKWWPETSLFYAFNQLFSLYGAGLDLDGEVLIVGGGAGAKFAVASALRAGFSKVNVTTKFDDQGISLITDLRRRYFGAQFEFVPQDRLVLLPGTNSLLINTTPLVPSNDLLAELYYLNFLRQDGMIWDLVVSPGNTQLIREGEQINIKCVRGREVSALSDHVWLSWALANPPDSQELLQQYVASFNDSENPPPPAGEKSRTLA
ncbi:MAG: hypothetical protein AB7N80_03135 [Bdellovibrionales bacterium]